MKVFYIVPRREDIQDIDFDPFSFKIYASLKEVPWDDLKNDEDIIECELSEKDLVELIRTRGKHNKFSVKWGKTLG